MEKETLNVKNGYKNLRMRTSGHEGQVLILWNVPDDSRLGMKSFKIWNAVKYSRAGNYYIVVNTDQPIHCDLRKKLVEGAEVELTECTLEARGSDIYLVDGWSDEHPETAKPQARHPAADRPNKDVVKIPSDIILDVKPLRSKWNLKLDCKEACNKYFTKEDLMTLEKVDGVKVDYIGDQLWIQYVHIVAGIQPKVTEDIYLDVRLGLITTKFDYNNGIVRIEKSDITDIEPTPEEPERIDICGLSYPRFSIATKPKTATFGITVYNPKLDKSECGGLMQSFHGRCSYLSAGNTELYLEFQTEEADNYPWSAVTAIIFDCKTRKAHRIIGCNKMDFKVEPKTLETDKPKLIDPQDSTVFPYEPYSGQWYEPKVIMVSSSCFTSDDRRKLEDAMNRRIDMQKAFLNSKFGYVDTDIVSIEKLSKGLPNPLEGTHHEFCCVDEWINPDYIYNEKAKQLINKRKGVRIMKKTEKTGPTVQEVFDSLTPIQRDTVYYLIGETIKEHSKGGAPMAMSQIKNLINEVIFEGPATVVMWADGTKTVVKAQHGEEVDREKGLALAMARKFYGNDKNYFDKISMQVFAYNLKTLMKKRGMKAKDIAEAMKENKVTVKDVETWMSGRGKINSNRIAKLAKILGVKEEALFAAKDKKPSRPRTKKKTEE